MDSVNSLKSGIKRGSLVEITGNRRTELLVQYLHEQFSNNVLKQIAWMEKEFSIFPASIKSQGINLSKISFIPFESYGLGRVSLLQVVRSGLFDCVISDGEPQAFTSSRQLQLAAEQTGTIVVFLTDQPTSTWPMNVQLETHGLFRGSVFPLREKFAV